ncbi:hypothetical protein QOK74_08295 [Staphylococcus saprophyticus]|uniref:hypothetical protein n=1 Tax=Staphylococcus saprophyticus TaxID=29385 RepID=UPI0024C2EA50|nr:hypothetical protein [Staphylococcus saprophyticus]MDK1672871.1 hypothetical protein [Staphylococcus saprophyticus]
MEYIKIDDTFKNETYLLNFKELQELAQKVNYDIIKETLNFEDRQTLLRKDFNKIDDIKETLESANIFIIEN